jgi:oligoendopeptidase F
VTPGFECDFSAAYPGAQAREQGMREMDAKMQAFAARQGALAQGPAAVLAACRAFDEIGKLHHRPHRCAPLQRGRRRWRAS